MFNISKKLNHFEQSLVDLIESITKNPRDNNLYNAERILNTDNENCLENLNLANYLTHAYKLIELYHIKNECPDIHKCERIKKIIVSLINQHGSDNLKKETFRVSGPGYASSNELSYVKDSINQSYNINVDQMSLYQLSAIKNRYCAA